jgi:drug/metabolite transporter (DMT)-like permease
MGLHKPSGRWRVGLALSLVTVLCWGTLPLFLKLALRRLDAVTLMWFRFLVAGVLLAAFLGARRRLPRLHRAGWPALGLLTLATLGLASNYLFYQLGLARVSAGTAQLLIQTSPLMLMLGSVALFNERLARFQIGGFVCLTVGFAFFFNDHLGELLTTMSGYTVGIIYILLAAVGWAVYALAQKQLLTTYDSSAIMTVVYVGSALLATPFAAPAAIGGLDSWGQLLLVYCALNTIIGYGAFAEALAHWDASRVSATIALSPIVTLAASALAASLRPDLVTPEHLNAVSYLGAVLVVAGAIAVAH